MNIIKIDRKSIKVNPRAGKTSTVVPGPIQVTLTFQGEIPDWLNEVDYVIESWEEAYADDDLDIGLPVVTRREPYKKYNVQLINHDEAITTQIYEYSKETGKVSIDYFREHHTYHHRPEPKYFYKYQNNTVTCCECGHKEKYFNLIQQDVETMCPECFELDGMRYRHEDINDVKNKP